MLDASRRIPALRNQLQDLRVEVVDDGAPGGGGNSFGGGSMVERNLDRATVFFADLFVINTLVLLKI